MDTPVELCAVVRDAVLAMRTGDRDLLCKVALPHPELGSLTPRVATAADRAAALEDLQDLQVAMQSEAAGRHVLHVWFRGEIHPMVAVRTPEGWRMDLRFSIATTRPQSEFAAAARRFLAAMLLADLDALRQLAVDAGGLELLAEDPPPAGEVDQLLHVAAAMPLVELTMGEDLPDLIGGRMTVTERHVDAGYRVFLGLFGGAELPFLVRLLDGTPKVSPFLFVRAAAKARGATVG